MQASGLESRKCFRFSLIYGTADSASNGPSHPNRPHTISSIPQKSNPPTHPPNPAPYHFTKLEQQAKGSADNSNGDFPSLLILRLYERPHHTHPLPTLNNPSSSLSPLFLLSLSVVGLCPPPLLPLHFFSTM